MDGLCLLKSRTCLRAKPAYSNQKPTLVSQFLCHKMRNNSSTFAMFKSPNYAESTSAGDHPLTRRNKLNGCNGPLTSMRKQRLMVTGHQLTDICLVCLLVNLSCLSFSVPCGCSSCFRPPSLEELAAAIHYKPLNPACRTLTLPLASAKEQEVLRCIAQVS